ncbi:MAG: insulinase family protein [Flavobacteriales bacterium]|nr:insulinase family protein [Flavobacteriales bacterium]
MKFKALIIIAIAFFITSWKSDWIVKKTYKYEYETVEGDVLNTFIYTLDNGLKIYMSVNKQEPRIQTNIAINTGSKQDPADATGLAHYLEHMVFKGTSKIATINWEKEKVLLKRISDLYERRRSVTDEAERKAIYHQIDSLSGEAAKFAVPNEYDKMISSIGAKGTNAYTSVEQTVYINDIPSNEFEKWLSIEAERFNELVLRLFHTELEAVYEEYNRSRDNDYWLAYETMNKAIFKKHQYGTQTTIGTSEHLKNPSMEKIHQYFSERYVPNNMAIILSGDLDPDTTVDLIKKYFGNYKSKKVPVFTAAVEDEITEPEYITVKGSDAAWVSIGYRLPGVKGKDIYMLNLFDGLLNNGHAGLIDLNLIKGQKVLDAYSSPNTMKDYSTFEMSGNPREGQSLDEVKDLLLKEVEKIKAGDFEEWMLPAVIKDFKLSEQQRNQYNSARAGKMTDAFIMGIDWADVVNEKEKLSKVTKKDIVDFANKYFNNNYIVVYKETGESNNPKVEKPAITQVQLNRDTASAFAANFEKMKSTRMTPVFDDYKTDIKEEKLNSGIPLYYVKNTTNETFSLNYILDMGSYSDKEMALAVEYLDYLGTDKYSANELQLELFKLGLSYSVYVARERVYVTLSGLDESFEEGVKLFEHILANVEPNIEAFKNGVQDKLKDRADAKLSKGAILYGGLLNYGQYGDDSPMKNIMSEEELKALDPNNLVSIIKQLTSYEHYIYYYGRKDLKEVKMLLNKNHKAYKTYKPLIAAKKFPELTMESNKVYFVNYDMVQSEVMMLSNAGPYNKDLAATTNVFNEYFGSGLSSIIFQEIRESKALAYSAYAVFTTPRKANRSHYVRAYVGTQVDKLNDAKVAIMELMNNMPEVEDQFQDSKMAALKKIETSRTKRSSLFWRYLSAKEMGRDYDLNKEVYPQIKELELKDLKTFFNSNIKGKYYTYLVIGNKELIDMDVLKEMGEFKELTLEEIFGY